MSDVTSSPSRPASPVAPLPDFSSSRPYRFQWDASNRKPGPASVSGTSEGRGDYFANKTPLNVLNFSSTSLALGAIPQEWSSAKNGFNAISTVVNSPHKKSAPPKAHAAVPPVPPSELPRVRRKDFDAYLKGITPEWERFEKQLDLGRDPNVGQFAAFELPPLPSELDEADSPTTPQAPRSFLGKTLPPLDSVPSIFFQRSFDLGDPRTFATVTEQDEQSGGQSSVESSLLEKLSHHADTIELHLIREISLRSSSFFAALTNLQDLQGESEQCLERVQRLRGMLKDVDDQTARKGLEVVQREMRLKNMAKVQDGVKEMVSVIEMISMSKGLVAAGEWAEALNVVEGLQNICQDAAPPHPTPTHPKVNGATNGIHDKGRMSPLPPVPESPTEEKQPSAPYRPSIPLSGLQAFAALPEHLQALTFDIASSLSAELVQTLRGDLLTRLEKGSPELSPESQLLLKDRLRTLLQVLARTKRIPESVAHWRGIALLEVSKGFKSRLPLSEDISDEDFSDDTMSTIKRDSAFTRNLTSMPHAAFLSLARASYSFLETCVQSLQNQHSTIVEVLQSLKLPDSEKLSSPLQADLEEILSSGTESAHSKVAKVLSLRSEQHAALELPDFLDIFGESWDFVIQTEGICRRMIVPLRGVIISQAKAFLQNFHQQRLSQSAKLVEEEQWSAVDVSPAQQRITVILIEAAMQDSPELVVPKDPALRVLGLPAGSPSNGAKSALAKTLQLEDRKYFVVGATLQILVLLADYLRVITNLSLLTTETVGRVIEFLKAFNSRTCQVVLGAGAMRSAGLKNITAKHLALASQSLSIVISLIPYIRECFRRHLNPKQAVMLVDFDRLKRDYQEHQNEINAKLIAIMGDRLSAHCKTLQMVDWSIPRESVNAYMELLVKETMTLDKVLSRYLPDPVVEYIMSQVVASINHRLSEEYSNIELPDQPAKDRMLRDARFLHQKLSTIKNIPAPTAMVETVILEKPIASKMVPSNPPSARPSLDPSISISPPQTASMPTPAPTTTTPPAPTESATGRIRSIFARTVSAAMKDMKHDAHPSTNAGAHSPVEKSSLLVGLPPRQLSPNLEPCRTSAVMSPLPATPADFKEPLAPEKELPKPAEEANGEIVETGSTDDAPSVPGTGSSSPTPIEKLESVENANEQTAMLEA